MQKQQGSGAIPLTLIGVAAILIGGSAIYLVDLDPTPGGALHADATNRHRAVSHQGARAGDQHKTLHSTATQEVSGAALPLHIAKKLLAAMAARTFSGEQDDKAKEQWTADELETALAWAKAQPSSPDRELTLMELGARLSAIDPRAALSHAGSYPEAASQQQFLAEVASHWTRRAPDAATHWAASLPEGPLREQVQSTIAVEWAQTNAPLAADYVATAMESGPAQESAARTVATRWASTEPRPVAEWAMQFPPGELRTDLLKIAVSYWEQRDRPSLEAWRKQSATTSGLRE